ncbi:WSC domain-containing protein [Psilocybe cubensis]|uniref:WSC domain-containing protein n=2 Tax=Psilocybe cubensis TaxID=181762 RepID=A0ACB8HAP7_PSICU|nr:WSC domain-containing protein [Psilocybe cubensis]KAH9484914.1 WSC domain-containing protein [Psilocybe cubensis]
MVASVVPGLLLAASISASITRTTATLSSNWDQRRSTNITVNPNTALPGWTFVGCFTDANGAAPTLQEHSLIDETNMTPALCMEFCGNFSTPLNFAGTELGNQCFCDFNIQGAPLQVNDTLCNVACAGDSTLTCGGPLLVSIYQNNNEGVGPLPTNKATVGAFEFAGCLKDADGTTVRTLSTPLTVDISDGVTAESCTVTCLENGFTKAGLEFGHECWCDSKFNVALGLIVAPLEECSRACDADPTELNAIDTHQPVGNRRMSGYLYQQWKQCLCIYYQLTYD